jgi:hypothetical protein
VDSSSNVAHSSGRFFGRPHATSALPDQECSTCHGELDELLELNDFFAALPHCHKVVVAGNHDWCSQHVLDGCCELLRSATYLQGEAATIEGVRFYGSPWQPWFFDWAFNLPCGPCLRAK